MENTIFKNLLPQYKIEGFDPNSALTKVVDIDENGQPIESLFMKYLPALEWFLTVYPEGHLNHIFVVLTDRKATVTASVYRHQTDVRPAMTATCSRFFEENPNGKYYEQNAVTAAYRKALGYLGFGTPLDAVEVDGIPTEAGSNIPERTDVGVIIPTTVPTTSNPQPDTEVPNEAKAPTKRTRAAKTTTVIEQQAPTETIIEKGFQISELPEIPDPLEVVEQQTIAEPVQEPLVAPAKTIAPVPQQDVPKTYEEALEVVVPYGDLVGKTVLEAAKERGPAFIRWHCDKAHMRAPGSAFAIATQLYCEFSGC